MGIVDVNFYIQLLFQIFVNPFINELSSCQVLIGVACNKSRTYT